MTESGLPARDLVERLGLAVVGAAALTAERIDELAGELAEKGGIHREDARQVLEEAAARWRADAGRIAARAGGSLQALLGQAGLVSRDDFDELELRLAQVEHRLRLLERSEERSSGSVQH